MLLEITGLIICISPIIVLMILFVLHPYIKHKLKKKKREKLAAVASELKLSFSYMADGCWIGAKDGQRDGESQTINEQLGHLHLFSQGWGEELDNMLHGKSDDEKFGCFDYKYVTGDNKNSFTHTQSVLFFKSSKLNLPMFALRPENLFHKIGGVFGYQDIDFPSHSTFSRKYLLRGTSEEQIRLLFNDGLLTFFESLKKVCVEGHGKYLIFYRDGKQVSPDKIKDFMNEGLQVFTQFCQPKFNNF